LPVGFPAKGENMSVESEAHTDLAVGEEDAEAVVGGRRTKKASAPTVKPAAAHTVAAISSPADPAGGEVQTPFPVLGDDDCVPIRYAGSSGNESSA
jgi:hypothetical protein